MAPVSGLEFGNKLFRLRTFSHLNLIKIGRDAFPRNISKELHWWVVLGSLQVSQVSQYHVTILWQFITVSLYIISEWCVPRNFVDTFIRPGYGETETLKAIVLNTHKYASPLSIAHLIGYYHQYWLQKYWSQGLVELDSTLDFQIYFLTKVQDGQDVIIRTYHCKNFD